MSTVHRSAGHTTFSWTEASPLKWEMTSPTSTGEVLSEVYFFDLTSLTLNYSTKFLFALKDSFCSRHKRV